MSATEDHKEAQVYEIGYLLLPSISEDKLDGVVDSIKKAVAKEGGAEIDGEAPFNHPLAYPISKTVGASRYVVNDAYLGWLKFEIEPAKAPSIKEALEKVDGMLRFLLIKAPRESAFTFAKAREKKALAEAALEEAAAAAEEPAAPVDSPAAEPVVE